MGDKKSNQDLDAELEAVRQTVASAEQSKAIVEAGKRAHEFPNFLDWIATDSFENLSADGLEITFADWEVLGSLIMHAHGRPSSIWSKKKRDDEERIAQLCNELSGLLKQRKTRTWCTAKWDADTEEVVYDDEIESDKFLMDLDTVRKTAIFEKGVHNQGKKDLESTNRSNAFRADRYNYWLTLIGFWRYRLGREVRVSTSSDDGKAGGPLVRFIQNMSSAGLEPKEYSGEAIRSFIKRYGDTDLYSADDWR